MGKASAKVCGNEGRKEGRNKPREVGTQTHTYNPEIPNKKNDKSKEKHMFLLMIMNDNDTEDHIKIQIPLIILISYRERSKVPFFW